MAIVDYPLNKRIDKLIIRSIATDGGTAYAEAVVDGVDGWQFYIDGRIESTTSGELYLEYPSEESSVTIDPDCAFAKSVKEMR